MIVGGCDIGSTTGKALILQDGEIAAYSVISATTSPQITAHTVMEEVVQQAGLSSLNELDYIVSTGYGRLKIDFSKENVSEVTCHGRGAQWLLPTVRTVVDIGGQDCKVMALNDSGRVLEFVMNDRCAAGTGRFFEMMARALNCGLEGFSTLALESDSIVNITSQCTVFAESEVITLVNEGCTIKDILAGLNLAIAGRLNSLVRKVGLVEDVVLTGGCAKNIGLSNCLENQLKVSVKKLPTDPQIAGALGAAIIAAERIEGALVK